MGSQSFYSTGGGERVIGSTIVDRKVQMVDDGGFSTGGNLIGGTVAGGTTGNLVMGPDGVLRQQY